MPNLLLLRTLRLDGAYKPLDHAHLSYPSSIKQSHQEQIPPDITLPPSINQSTYSIAMTDNTNPGNFANRPKEEVQEIASKGGKASHTGGFASMPKEQVVRSPFRFYSLHRRVIILSLKPHPIAPCRLTTEKSLPSSSHPSLHCHRRCNQTDI